MEAPTMPSSVRLLRCKAAFKVFSFRFSTRDYHAIFSTVSYATVQKYWKFWRMVLLGKREITNVVFDNIYWTICIFKFLKWFNHRCSKCWIHLLSLSSIALLIMHIHYVCSIMAYQAERRRVCNSIFSYLMCHSNQFEASSATKLPQYIFNDTMLFSFLVHIEGILPFP